MLIVSPTMAQSSVDGSWNPDGGGTWGTLTNWSYSQSMRPAVITTSLNPAPVITVVRTNDKITAINVVSGGLGYTTAPAVIIPDPGANGYPARAKANISGGEITSFTILDQGAGYTSTPTVTITREISGMVVTDAGSGYAKVPEIAFNGGGAYTSPPAVTFRGGLGSGATATATVAVDTGSNRVTSITVTNGGSGYSAAKPPTIAILNFAGGSVTTAVATATVDANGVVTGITVTNKGSGYNIANPPRVIVVSPDPNDIATATAIDQDGRVIGVEINNPGSGYTAAPQVIFSGGGAVATGATYATAEINAGGVSDVTLSVPPDVPQGGASGAVAAVTLLPAGAISSINLLNRGQGYTSVPTVVVGAPTIRTAIATAERTGNVVTQVNVQNAGAGYLAAPTVTFGTAGWRGYTGAPRVRFVSGGVTGAIATATINTGTGAVTGVSIQDGGESHIVAPTVTFVGGNGRNAAATATVSGGGVSAIAMTNTGDSYGVTPTIIFSGGGGSGAVATANLTAGRVTSITVNNPGSGYTSAPSLAIVAGNVANPATGTATIATSGTNIGRVTGVSIISGGSGYTSTPTVTFTIGGVTFATATSTVTAGRLTSIRLTYAGSGYSLAPSVNLTANIASGGIHGTATVSVSGGKLRDAIIVTTPGGADPASGTAVLAANGSVQSVNVTSGGNGYIADPTVTFSAPTGITTPMALGPGGVGAYVQFNRDITGNRTITLDSARTVGSLSIGDTGGEDYTLSAGTGGSESSLTFSMGTFGAGKSFLNKLQGDQDVINARVNLLDELNVRVNAGRLTLADGISGIGSLALSGNAILTVRGNAPTSNVLDLWLWNRGFGNAGPQVELASVGGPAFGNVRLGNVSMGTAGHAVLQLLQGRAANELDQIRDDSTVTVDAVTNRWGYFKLMGGDETIGNIIDVGNALVLENMEGETVNTNSVLTLGGNNLDSYIGGFIRNRSGGSGTGTMGITKNGTGSLTLQGGNINYTGLTMLNNGMLRLTNTSNFASSIVAAAGTQLEIETTSGITVNFDDDVIGDADFTKLGIGALNFNSGQLSLQDYFMTAGSVSVRPGAATQRGGKNVVTGDFIVRGDGGLNKTVTITSSLSVGSIQAEGRYGQTGSIFDVTGQQFNVSNIGYASEGVLESSGPISISNMQTRLNTSVLAADRTVQNAVTNSVFVTLTDANNLIVGSIFTLRNTEIAGPSKKIPQDTRIVTVNLANRTLELSKAVTLAAGTLISCTYTNQTDGSLRGESLNFADVVHDGRKFVAITEKGTIYSSLNGTIWDLLYSDPAEVPYYSLTWTGERFVVVGDLGRVLTSTDGSTWSVQSSSVVSALRSITSTSLAFTGNLVAGSSTVLNVSNGLSFLVGMPVAGNATPPDARISTATVASNTMVLDSPALATATEVNFGYFKGSTTANSTTVTNVRTAQTLATGFPITGTGIPVNTTILATNGPNSRITLSQNAGVSLAGVDLFTLTGNTVLNSTQITNLSNTAGLFVGMVLKGVGIPSGARITALNTGAATLTLSVPVPATRTSLPLSVFTGRLVSGNAVVEDVTNIGAYTAGMVASGRLLPAGTIVVSSTASSVTLSQQASATGTALGMTVVKTLMTKTGNFSAGSASVTGVSDLTGLVAGMSISAPGVLPADTVIQIVGAGTLTLSRQALTSPTGQPFQAGFDLMTVGDAGRVLSSVGGASSTWVNVVSASSRDLNAISWNGSRLVAVGANSDIIRSDNGIAWSRLTPPLTAAENLILDFDGSAITLNNAATLTASNVSFGAVKGSTTTGSDIVTNITGMYSLRVGMPVFAQNGIQTGTTVRSINEGARTMVLSSPATAGIAEAPIQTFTGVSVNGSNFITEVTDFKGLMPGMALHGTALPTPAIIIDLDPAAKRITLASAANQSTRAGFGVLYGQLTNGSANVSAIKMNTTGVPTPPAEFSIRTVNGRTAHLTPGKAVAAYPGRIGSGVTISAFNSTENTLTLSASAIGTGYVPLYTFTGTTNNGSNLITGVAVGSFAGLTVGKSIYVAGTLNPVSTFNTFTITALDSTRGEITLSGAPSLNVTNNPEVVALGVFTGFATSGQAVIRSISNRLGEPPPLLYQSDLQEVVWTGTQFIAVGSYGAIMTSPDGVVWTPRDSATGRDLYSIGVSGAQFLAAGEDGLILKSTNGTTWTVVRAADSPTLNDVRQLGAIQAVIAASGKTLALGSGGLSSADGSTWLTTLSDTFSGTQTSLIVAGRLGQGGILTLNNEVTTSPTTDPVNGPLTNRNNPNRIDDAMTLESRGGAFEYVNNNANATFSETIGKLLISEGQMQLSTFRAGTTGTTTLTFGSLEALPGATVDFLGRENGASGVINVVGSIGENTRNRILFTQTPVLDDGIIGGWATIDNEWATYGATGLRRLDPVTGYDTGDQPGWIATDNVKMQVGRTLNAPRAINSLNLQGQTLTMNSQRLSIETGGLLTTGNPVINSTGGVLSVGTGRSTPKTLNIINPGTFTINAPIDDFQIAGALLSVAATQAATVLTLGANNMVGLVVGMEVSGAGIADGTRISSIDTATNRITLTQATTTAIPTNTILAILGGSVGLSKSGTGTLVLNATNSYSGKTYLNNGIVQIANFSNLGTTPAAFAADHIQLNGGTLMFRHTITGVAPLPDDNKILNDGKMGLTIGIAGGRIEVGTNNPDNDGVLGAAVPKVNLSILNPINAIGVLEVAVRANPSLLQFNSITLGSPTSTNTYRAGIKTEAGFEGDIIIRGNNSIGGIYSEGGNLTLEGNNDLTGPIRSVSGNIFISGTNTWKGGNTFTEPLVFSGGSLQLSSNSALGAGGLNLDMGNAARLNLAGISQTIREITSLVGAVISNDKVPNGFTGSTSLVFDMDLNQSFIGTLENGRTLDQLQIAGLKLIKQGPATLNLTNSGNSFSAGIEIREGALNVTSISNVGQSSALGIVYSDNPSLLLLDKSVLSFTPDSEQRMNRSLTIGAGPNGATLVANGAIQSAIVILGEEIRDVVSGTTQITAPIAFKDSGVRTLTLSGIGRGDNQFLLELGDNAPGESSGLFKTGSGTWVLGKANPYSGLTTIQEGILAVTRNNVLGTVGNSTAVDQSLDTFTGSLPNGTPVSFPLFAATTLPGGVSTDTQYYVVGSTGTTFQIASTPGGAVLPISSNGANVKVVPKIDSFRSALFDVNTDTFTGALLDGQVVTFNTKITAGVATPLAPGGMLTNSVYYVINANNGTFQVSVTPPGQPQVPADFTTTGTPGALYYATNASGNTGAGVNLSGGTLELRNTQYLTPENLIFEGGALSVPAGSSSSWAGDIWVNAASRITVGQGGELILNGNLLGSRSLNQEGEGTVVLRGETLAPVTNLANSAREYAVRAGTLILDYSVNNASKLLDNTNLRLGGSRRGGTVILSGGSHEEIIGQLVLESGASGIYRESGSSTISLNNVFRTTGSSLYVDGGRLAKIDNPNLNGILGAWAIARNSLTHAFWVIPGTSSFTYQATANPATNYILTNQVHVVTVGSVVRFTSTGDMPGGLVADTPYFVQESDGAGMELRLSQTFGGSVIDITSSGTGTLTMVSQPAFRANSVTDTLSTVGGHGLSDGVKVRVSSYGQLPGGLFPDTDYFVVGAQTSSFRLSASLNGQAVDISSLGTGAHVFETQGTEKRSGPASLLIRANPDYFPGVEGNQKIRVAIQYAATMDPISSSLTGLGTIASPYVFTILTTAASNSNFDIQTLLSSTNYTVSGVKIADVLSVSSPNTPSSTSFPTYARISDAGNYGAPTFLDYGTNDNGSTELGWAANGGIPGSPTTTADGYIVPLSSYSGLGNDLNTDIKIDTPAAVLLNPFSVRFATQSPTTMSVSVNANPNGIYSIRSGGILVSPTVGANDSTISGLNRFTTENQGNLQNLMLHQHNEQGDLIINSRITNRQAVTRSAYLTADNRTQLIMGDVSSLALGWTVAGTGITGGTKIVDINLTTKIVTLDRNHDNVYRVTNFTFTSPDNVTVIVRQGEVSNPGRRNLVGMTGLDALIRASANPESTDDKLVDLVGATVTGPGLTNPTTIEAVLDNHSVRLSRDHDGAYRRGSYTVSGGGLDTTYGFTATVADTYRRRVVGVVRPVVGNPATAVSTTDLYLGMPISGPGIPFGSTITSIYNESDIEVSTNHFYTGEQTSVTFTPLVGVEKLGAGTVALTGDNDYSGLTFIADGTLRVNQLTDGGVSGGLGSSSASSANLVFNGGTLQYVGDNGQTNRGFTIAESATFNIGHEHTTATFSGSISSGLDVLVKEGPGTLRLNGNANLGAMQVNQGYLLLESVDTNPSPGAFSPANFSQSNLTSLILGGGTFELRGSPEGNVTQNFGSQLTISTGATTVKATSVAPQDPSALTFPFTRLNLMGQEEITPVIRHAGGTVHFMENPEGGGVADIFLYLPTEERQLLLPWATYQDVSNISRPGVNHFATVAQATTGVDTSGGGIISAETAGYDIGSGLSTPSGWATVRNNGRGLNISEGALGAQGPLALTGNVSTNRFVNILRYSSKTDGTVTIDAGRTLELVGGAILAANSVFGGLKTIAGPGNITGGAINDRNSDFIFHNYNAAAPFTLGANIVDRSSKAVASNGTTGKGTLKAGQSQMNIETGVVSDFFSTIRPGMKVSGPGIQAGTLIVSVESVFRRIILSLPALSDQTSQIYTFTDTTNFIQAGVGTTILAGNNTYTGNTYVHGGVLRLESANAVPGGISPTGGTSALVVENGVIGLGAGDFNRTLGEASHQIQFTGNGGFAAYGADRTVNFGGLALPSTLRFGNNGFVPDGASLILGSHDATHKLSFANPIDLSAFSQAVRTDNGPADVEGELTGSLSGLGRLIKFGLGTLRLGGSNTHAGGIEIAEGRLIAGNVANVFGTSSGAVRLGTSLTNTTSRAAINLQVEGGTVANPLQIGAVNSRGGAWVAGGTVDSAQSSTNVGEESSAAVVDGYPAVSYYDTTTQDLKYVRALDPRGVSWGVPVRVAQLGNAGRNPSLDIINGNPAISYHDESTGALMYVRANDAQGVTWGTPVSVLGQASPVLAVALQPDGKAIVGGSFTKFDGMIRNRLVRLNTDGSLDDTFNAFIMNGEVRTILVLPDGKILVGGTFTAIRQNATSSTDTTRNRLARFNADGTLDTSLNPDVNGDVRVLVPQTDGKIIMGGSFTTVTGVGRTRLARLNSNNTLDTSFGSTDIRNGEVRAIIPENTDADPEMESYLIGGSFTDIRGTGNRNRLARINSDASLAAFNPNANNVVFDMVPLANGKLLVGGAFTGFTDSAGNFIARTRLGRLNSTGTVDETFGQEVNNEVRKLQLETSGNVLVAGIFTQLGNVARRGLGRVLVDGTIDATYAPEPDNEVRSMVTLADGKLLIGGIFNNAGGVTQQLVGRLEVSGAADVGFGRNILDVGFYSSLHSVNGSPAIAYYDSINQDVYYIRSTDANGGGWPNPELIDSAGDVGVGISLTMGNFGGDTLTRDNRGTQDLADDEVTIGAIATSGTPVIAYGDSTNSRIKYAVADNVNGAGFTGVGLSLPVRNWSSGQTIPGTGAVGRHFSLASVDGFPGIVYQSADTLDLKFIRALSGVEPEFKAGIKHNLRDPADLSVLKILVSALTFTPTGLWDAPITLDSTGDVGAYPSISFVNGQPTTVKSRPAVSYYDASNGDLKYVSSSDSAGSAWNTPIPLVTIDDVGRSSTLLVSDGMPAVTYYNATSGDLGFIIFNDASGYSRISFTGDTTWSGSVALNGSLMLSPAVGTTTQISGTITGPAGIRLMGEGILNLTALANNFATSLSLPGVSTGPGAPVNGGVILRTGTLHLGSSGALGSATVELGDFISQVLSVDRATSGASILNSGGVFNPLHDGQNVAATGPGAFVGVSATIDGRYFGLVATTADTVTERFTGDLPNGTAIQFFGVETPFGIEGGLTYYVRSSNGINFQVSATPGGSAATFNTEGDNLFFIELDKLNAQILVKDQAENPEWNGVYRPIITPDTSLLEIGQINLVRVAALDSVNELQFGVRVLAQNGTSAGKAYLLGSSVADLNVSAVHWIQEASGGSVALLANQSGITVGNAIDINAIPGSAASILGGSASVNSGSVTFSGPVTLQNLASTAQDAETLQVTSSTSAGFGVRINGVVSESAVQDVLTLNKTGSGVLTLGGNNTFKGGISINQGSLLIMNTPSVAGDSGTGSGMVTVNAGTLLGGVGTIGGPVILGGSVGSSAILRPGDPTSSSAPVETLTINQPLTVGANSVLEFYLGATNMTKLAGTSIDLTTATSSILVQLDPGYDPVVGTAFDILDFTPGGFQTFGGTANLLNLLQLPVSKAWDISQFFTTGVITVTGDSEPAVITDDPDDLTVLQKGSATFTVAFTGTGPVAFQWMKDGLEIEGATQQTLVLTNVDQSHEGAYTVRVTNPVTYPAGDVSLPAELTVDWSLAFPVGGNLPSTRKGSVGDPVTFRVIVDGEGSLAQPITYQWQKNGVNIVSAPNSNTYTIDPASSLDAGVYRVLVFGPDLFNANTQSTVPLVSANSTLTVSNGPAVVLESPISQTVLQGATVTLTSLPGGNNNFRVMQWRRNGAAILGETANTLIVPNITVAQAGEYTTKVDNKVTATGKASSAVSDPAHVVVVENPNRIVAGQIGKSVKLTVNVGSSSSIKPEFRWLKNGTDLPPDARYSGATTKTLTINVLAEGDTATYTCRIKGASGTAEVVGGTHFLRVYETSPELDVDKLDPADVPVGMVGSYYSWKIPVTSDVAGTMGDPTPDVWKATPVTYGAKGLPAGLKIDATTGYITGRPTVANTTKNPAGYPVTISVANAIKATDVSKTTRNIIIDIKPLPVGVAGVFAGPVQRHSIINSFLGGRFDMTVTTAGSFSGSLTMGGEAARKFAGAFNLNLDANGLLIGSPSASVSLPGTKTAPPVTLNFSLGIVAATVVGEPPVTVLHSATIVYQAHSVGFSAWRNNFAAKVVDGVSKLPTAYQGLYNVGFVLPDGPSTLIANPAVPQGAGYATFTVSASGAYTLATRTADGEKLTGSYWVGPTGQLFIYQALYTTVPKGSLLGTLQIELGATADDNDVSGSLDWVRPKNTKATHRLYKDGFGLPGTPVVTSVALTALGGRFIEQSATAGTVFGSTAPTTANLEFSEDGEFSPTPADSDVTTFTNPDLIGITVNAGTKLVQPVITAATKITPTHKTGAITGTGTLIDNGGALKRKLVFQGLMIRVRTSGLGIEPRITETYGTGYFILDQIPVGAEKPTTSPQRSGIFSFKD
jgi:uncharacterized delta-60 repeat protein